jgi:acyl-CoA synthetase (AMP-forming)/AMP-acid ligase II
MISGLLERYAISAPERAFVIDARGIVSARGAFEQLPGLVEILKEMGENRVYFYIADSARLVLAVVATEAAGLQCCVLNRQSQPSEIVAILERLGSSVLVTDAALSFPAKRVLLIDDLVRDAATRNIAKKSVDSPVNSGAVDYGKEPGTIVVLTTGTTGIPKAARYTWERLLGRIPSRDAVQGKTWLLAYPLNHFAGVQVLLAALRDRGTLVIPAARDFRTVIDTLIERRVDSVSGTPTFWRMLVGRVTDEEAKRLWIEQITLGGEASTAELLDRLRTRFPSATITQIYATTEAGSCFAVKDGLPGFPASFLDRPVGNVALKIIDGELYVRSAAGMIGYIDGNSPSVTQQDWTATGDLVERTSARVLFRGRKSEIINVGGVKVHPLKVEEIILRVPGVSAVRAYSAPNPITGQIVACDIELEEGADENAVRETAQHACLAALSRYEQPRRLRIVHRLERRNEKLVRSGSA